jgi:hypothetical protein
MSRHQERRRTQDDADRKRRASRRLTMLVAAALLAGLLLYAWFVILRHDPKNLIGKPLPTLAYVDLSGAEHRVSDHRDGPFLLVVVRTECAPCDRFLGDLSTRATTESARTHTLALFLQRPEPDKTEAVKRRDYPFSGGFVRKLRDAAPLQVIVVPTAFLAVDGRIIAAESAVPDRLASLVASFESMVQ